MSEENNTTHKHLCRKCGQKYECAGGDCAEFEFGTCEKCKAALAKKQKQERK